MIPLPSQSQAAKGMFYKNRSAKNELTAHLNQHFPNNHLTVLVAKDTIKIYGAMEKQEDVNTVDLLVSTITMLSSLRGYSLEICWLSNPKGKPFVSPDKPFITKL